MMGKVCVELMEMYSDSGYVSSSGRTKAILVSVEKAASCMGDENCLFELKGEQVVITDLQDVAPESYRSGVCNYRVWKGVFDVPEGMTLVQQKVVNISTADGARRTAWVPDDKSLKRMYKERAEMYLSLAE